MAAPLIGITADLDGERYRASPGAAAAVSDAGAVPVLLPCRPERVEDYLGRLDGVILSGGDDPIMEQWGVATHPRATPIDPRRQAFELALLAALEARPQFPALGICLGMQLMGLVHGGTLDQHLPESLETAAVHWPRTTHRVEGPLGEGTVHSHHRQALRDPGALQAVAWSPDGVIEAVGDGTRAFYLGVQWHPERTEDARLGSSLVARLVEAARRACTAAPRR